MNKSRYGILALLVAIYLGVPFSVQAQDEGPFDESEPPFAPPIQRKDVKPVPKVEKNKGEEEKSVASASSDSNVQALEQQLYELVNKDRAKMGQGPLKLNSLLCKMAKTHAQDMMDKKYFSHTNKDGLDAQARAQKMGIGRGVYENIAYQYGDVEKPQMVINLQNDFMSEPEGEKNHRYNILHPDHCCVGVGVVVKGDKLILVEEFTDSEPGSD